MRTTKLVLINRCSRLRKKSSRFRSLLASHSIFLRSRFCHFYFLTIPSRHVREKRLSIELYTEGPNQTGSIISQVNNRTILYCAPCFLFPAEDLQIAASLAGLDLNTKETWLNLGLNPHCTEHSLPNHSILLSVRLVESAFVTPIANTQRQILNPQFRGNRSSRRQ